MGLKMKLQKKPISKGKLRAIILSVTLSALMIGGVASANVIDKKIDDKLSSMYSARFHALESGMEVTYVTSEEPGEYVVCDGKDMVSFINTLELVDKLNLTQKLIDYKDEYDKEFEEKRQNEEPVKKVITKKYHLASIVADSKGIAQGNGAYMINNELYTDGSYVDLENKELVKIVDEEVLDKETLFIYSETEDNHPLKYEWREKSK